jgi:ABC-2 type transport system permease protein
MNPVAVLIRPRLLAFKHGGLELHRGIKVAIMAGIGLAFWAGIFTATVKVVSYLRAVEEFGDVLTYKLLSMVLLTFFSLLIFSSVLACLSKLYLSKDLSLVHAMPVASEKIYLARWLESTVDSSWMVAVYALPIFLAYGWVFEAGIAFYANIGASLLPLCIIASAIGSLLVMLAVNLLPANRLRSIFVFAGLGAMIVFYVAFRLARPERLVDPEAFASVLIYLRNISAPASPWLPSTWAYDSFVATLSGQSQLALFHAGLAWSCAVFFSLLSVGLSKTIYFSGYSKSQMAVIRLFNRRGRWARKMMTACFTGPVRAFITKEAKTFWRDQTQWSQIFLIAALVVIYVYNFSVLPLERSPIKTVYLQNLLAFLNMALAAFVLTAVTARFAYPSVSTEGAAFWIVRSGPVTTRTYLWIKFIIYWMPLLLLTEVLIIITNMLLQVTPFMMWLSTITLFCITPGVVSLGIGLGAAFPDFGAENPAQTVTSFGGLTFMILSALHIGVVIFLEAGPVYRLFMADLYGHRLTSAQWVWVASAFAGAFVICCLMLYLPMRYGTKKLERGRA